MANDEANDEANDKAKDAACGWIGCVSRIIRDNSSKQHQVTQARQNSSYALKYMAIYKKLILNSDTRSSLVLLKQVAHAKT